MKDNAIDKINKRELLKDCIYSHTLIFTGIQVLLGGLSKKSLEISNLARENLIIKRLRKRYKQMVDSFYSDFQKETVHNVEQSDEQRRVWICWLQGIEEAPELVKICYNSVIDNCKGREIVLLTEDNYREYAVFPNYIQTKIDNGTITKTHFSDLLRLELLTQYGGTWIDATVFFSGSNYPDYFFESDLFMFQTCKPGLSGHPTRISSWFMTSCPGNEVLLLAKTMLYHYWKQNTKMVSYFLLHDFIELSIEKYENVWNKVYVFENSSTHILQYNFEKEYSEKEWELIKTRTAIHKLTYKNIDRIDRNGNYLTKLLCSEL